jgi:NADH dehydrogenase [ubiquinone] 1 alpha subcomplex assembly factor 7
LNVSGPLTQGEFLRRLGIEQRATRLKANATPQQAADIDSALARLIAPDQMGELFKVLAIADPKLGMLPGFDS